jgi:outer membrane protein OmpA-like peptidoglycan-associated protein
MSRIITSILLMAVVVAASAQEVRITPVDHNTSSDDFAPSPTSHGRVLIISSEKSGKQQLYAMERTSSGWTEPKKLSGDVNDGSHVGSAALTSDGQTMIFAAYEHDVDGQGRTDLYSATKKDGSWYNVKNLGGAVNSGDYDSQPTITADGRTIYFVSDRFGGKGGTDIYVTSWTGKDWTVAKPVEGVNTSSDEMSPEIAADGRSMTFSSNRPGGAGGFDIYTATVEGGKATNVQRLGEPINTSADELFYVSIPNSNQAYFSRGNPSGDYDNFMAVPNPFPGGAVTLVEGIVRDILTKEPLGAEVTLTDLTTGKAVANLRSDDRTGEYYATLTPGRQYSITAKRPGYLFHSERYDVPPNAAGQTIKKDIDLSPLEGGGGRLLVFFDYDKAELKPESYPELERVIELMRENPSIRMRFEGHTDDQGSDDYNMDLSKRRAKTVRDYVVNGGINEKRVESNGFGESRPLVKETTEAARAMNRRVEMRVLD